ncbi:hypothetical protein ALC60_06532 [Trachymyrmex zeteki]|uniref:Uncharacterized protein n=1 Tax=Mycetomoellerius zeteki TaxID=64791 RepID=A0A151X2J2_9HYME|nr:hypothetical protein ALC60_06532 [Trachymyrmex zeteki]
MARKPGIVTGNGRRSTPLTERKLESRRRSWEDNHSPRDLCTNRTTAIYGEGDHVNTKKKIVFKHKCGIILVKLKSLTDLQVLSSQKSPEDPKEEIVEQSLSKQSEVEKQSRRSQVVYLMAP